MKYRLWLQNRTPERMQSVVFFSTTTDSLRQARSSRIHASVININVQQNAPSPRSSAAIT